MASSSKKQRRLMLRLRQLYRLLYGAAVAGLLLLLLRALQPSRDPSVAEFMRQQQQEQQMRHQLLQEGEQGSRGNRGSASGQQGSSSSSSSTRGASRGLAGSGSGSKSAAETFAQSMREKFQWHAGLLFPRGSAASGADKDKEKEKERVAKEEELVRKIERWSERPTSLCFGHGNITILTVTVDLPHNYVVMMRKNRLHYCTLVHQCRYCDVPVNLDYSRPVAWTKVKAMQLVLSFSDVVVHMDADALIVNSSVPLTRVLDLARYNTSAKDVVYTTDFQLGRDSEPSEGALINTGVYVMRSTPWSKAFLEVQYRFYRSSIYHKFWDQDAVMLYRMKHRRDFHDHVALVPYRYMNVPCSHKYNDYARGDFIVHYAGGHSLEKYQRLSKMFLE